MYKKIIILLTLLTGICLAENYAVVNRPFVDLLNERGVSIKRLNKGAVVKIKSNNSDRSICSVAYSGKDYFARRSSFKVITSMLDEEQRLKQQVIDLNSKKTETDNRIDIQNQYLNQFNSKILELEIWIEVQRDLSYSREYFQQKTKGSFAEINEYRSRIKKAKINLKDLYEVKEELVSSIKNIEELSIKLSVKLVPLKQEKAMYDKGVISLNVTAENAPVYNGGKVFKYLKAGTVIKARRDSALPDWFVFNKGKNQLHISSAHVEAR